MKSVKILTDGLFQGVKFGRIIRVTDSLAETLVRTKRARYMPKSAYKAQHKADQELLKNKEG